MRRTTKWHLTMRMNPDLSTKHQTNRTVDDKKKKWKDEINDFLKPKETKETEDNENKKQWHVDKSSKKSWKMKSNGNTLRSCNSEPPLIRNKTMWPRPAIWHIMNSVGPTKNQWKCSCSWFFSISDAIEVRDPQDWQSRVFEWAAVRGFEFPKDWWSQTTRSRESVKLFCDPFPDPTLLLRTESEDSTVLISQLCLFFVNSKDLS